LQDNLGLYDFEIGNAGCACDFSFLGQVTYEDIQLIHELTFTPDTVLVGIADGSLNGLYQINQITGEVTPYFLFDINLYPVFYALVCVAEGIYYTMQSDPDLSQLWRINTNDGTITFIGDTGHDIYSDMVLYDGMVYYYSRESGGIIQVDIENPSNSTLIVNTPNNINISGLTASPFCNTLLGVARIAGTSDYSISSINLSDGALNEICNTSAYSYGITSMLEFADLSDCQVTLDLDCNDSSGATGADYNSSTVTCLMRQASVADEDVRMFYDDWIAEMTIRVNGFVPDGLNEIIDITGSIPGIDVDGQGTDLLTLSNAGGAKSTDFIDALHLVRYMNTALNPTAGERTIEVQFTTQSGGMSNVAIAYIQVNELPPLDVDLGPDQIICDGSLAFFDAGSFPGGMYQWSSGQMTQTITTIDDGQYIVTISDATHCPGTDTAEVVTIPLISVALTGDVVICDNQSATLILNTDAPFPITVEIQADPGAPFVFDDVVGNYSFTDLPQENTTYTITSVTPSMEACITVTDVEQLIDVYPAYNHSFDVSICDGDSVWLGFYWETEAGEYENAFNSIQGCDSVVTTTITILPAVMIQMQEDTCDASAVGVYITTIDNPNGCDTVVTTTISLISADTTYLYAESCVSAQVGVVYYAATGSDGCDSLIITTTSYIPPADTTFVFAESCDSAQVGVVYNAATGVNGCDSIVMLTITLMPPDTTFLFAESCDSAQIGVVYYAATGMDGCDSIIITTTTLGMADSTWVNLTSCDSSDVGVIHYAATGVDGCDSLIITTVAFAAQDSVWITGSTCNSADTGVFVSQYTNQFGCDSIVTETITLLPSDETSISSTTCDGASAGVFVTTLSNQYGCDSIVTETVTLLPSDDVMLSSTTCVSSEAGVFVNTLTNQYGCDSIVTLTVSLVPSDTTLLNYKTCDPAQTGVLQYALTGIDGCDSLLIEMTTLFPLPQLTLQSLFDYNGYGISCEGGADGGAIAQVNGVGPFSYLWSTSDTTQTITGLSAGDYDVAITDGNGCMTDGTVTLTAPDAFMIGFEVSEPDCFDQQLGSITVVPSGGVAPFTYSIDGTVFQASPVFTGLEEGIYQITSLDANDCSATEIISIDVPLMVNVELGDNQSISIGDSVLLEAIINLPFDSLASVMWMGIDSVGCANCLTQIVAPVITTAYSVSVTSADGCADRDSVTVQVTTDHKLYIPNIFSPNGDGINDVVMISADEGVREITSFSIFDRWGNLLFTADHFQPNDPTVSWDGKLHGEAMNPGVFTYRVIIVYVTGETEVRYGDVTLIR
jgi:gliding motility-associated-like protein